MSRRTERLGHLIRTIVAETIQSRLSDPRIPPITSVTRVEVSEDLSAARVYVSVMADDVHRKLCLSALRSATGLLRRTLAPQLRLRKIPALEFRLDESLRQGLATLAAIDGAMRELGEVPEWERADADAEAEAANEATTGGPRDRDQCEAADPQTGVSDHGDDDPRPQSRAQEGT